MTEIAMRDDQLNEVIAAMQQQIEDIRNDNVMDRKQQQIDDVEAKLEGTNDTIDMFRMEFRNLSHADKKNYREKLKAHKQAIKAIRNDLEWLKENETRNDLLGDHVVSQKPDADSAEAIMSHGRKLQQESVAALKRIKGNVADTHDIGRDVAVKLDQQTQQISHMYDDLYEIDDMLTRSQAILKRMLRRTLTNRYIWIMTGCIFIGIVFIIVYKSTEGGSTQATDQLNSP